MIAKRKVNIPSGFTWAPTGFKVWKKPNGKFKSNIDVANYKFTGTNYYVDVTNGNDGNTGLNVEHPKKSIASVITDVNVNINSLLKVTGGEALVGRDASWTSQGGYSWLIYTANLVTGEGGKVNPDLTTVIGRSYTVTAKLHGYYGNCKIKVVAGSTEETVADFTLGQTPTVSFQFTATDTTTVLQFITRQKQVCGFNVDEIKVIDGVTGENIMYEYQSNGGELNPIVINLASGLYTISNGFNNTAIPLKCAIVAQSGAKPILSAENTLSYSLTGGQTNTYQAAETTQVRNVFDGKTKDSNGDYVRYTKQTSIANVEANPGSWYWNSNVLYVHTTDNRVPDSDIHAYLAVINVAGSGYDLYMENIEVHGGGTATVQGAVSHTSAAINLFKLYMKNCKVKYANVTALSSINVTRSTAYLQNCECAKSAGDGFGYHTGGYTLEIDCVGRDNGAELDNQSNGSTMHEVGKIIRINGEYMRNNGPNIADVTASTLSWNMGVKAYSSLAANSENRSDMAIADGSMWVDSCKSYGSTYGLSCGSGTLYVKKCKEAVGRVTGGTINSY